jgi:hypothetical protein
MRRRIKVLAAIFAVASVLVITSVASSRRAPSESHDLKGATKRSQEPHTIKVTPWGPDQITIDTTKRQLLKHPTLLSYLKGKRYRMLSFDFIESAVKSKNPEPPTRYRATFFDYTSNRAIVAEGSFNAPGVEASLSTEQPVPSPEEFEAAVSIVAKDPQFAAAIGDGSLQPYPSMPPLADIHLTTDKVERTVTVGLMSKEGTASNEVVGVNMIRESVLRYEGGAPPTSLATPALNCGVPSAGQSTTSSGTAGQYDLVISRGTEEIWRMTVIRPSASSGNNRSGIELRDVKYHTKSVLARANVPILNVQYYRNACGPFRDWSWQEGMFAANGTYVVGGGGSGVMLCTDEPQTVIDNGTDTGNFRGVAIYDREEVTLVSELNAGWYRYISKWTFSDDGVISPRFGFAMVTNSCVCQGHIHHAYWRFDFDILSAGNNAVAEFNQTALKTVETESMRARLGPEQFWVVRNSLSQASVIIRPGPKDGNYDKYGRGDLWLLLNRFPLEIDDSAQTGSGTEARLDPMLNNENILNKDIVVWYASHYVHDHFDSPTHVHGDGPSLCGPNLILQGY